MTRQKEKKKTCIDDLCLIAVDEELFEDNPIEYIRRDLEGSGKAIFITYKTRFITQSLQTPTRVVVLLRTLSRVYWNDMSKQ